MSKPRIKDREQDMVKVIRCKACKWYEPYYAGCNYGGWCHACKHNYKSGAWDISIYRTSHPDFFCADGEKKGVANDY